MNWRDYFYIISLCIVWLFLISGVIVRKEEVTLARLKKDIKNYLLYYLIVIFMPQLYIILCFIQFIFDRDEFKQMVKENYKRGEI